MSTDGAFNPLTDDAAVHAASLEVAPIPAGTASEIGTRSAVAYEAAAFDAQRYLRFTNAGAVTFTIPKNSKVPFPVGTEIEFEQAGVGAVTVAPASGVTINCRGADFTLAGQFAVACLKKVGSDTWTLTGDL